LIDIQTSPVLIEDVGETMKTDNNNNKYRNVLIIVQRAKQLHNGAHPRVYMPGSRATRIAREEVERKLIGFDYVPIPTGKR
jgi:DNA-directed RNA polymerase subunit K/omega